MRPLLRADGAALRRSRRVRALAAKDELLAVRQRLSGVRTHHKVVRSRNLSFVPTDLVLIRGEVWLGLSGVRPKLIELDAQTLRIRRRLPLVP